MATFKYQGRTTSGGQVEGNLDSPSNNAAVAQLAQQGIIVTKIEETKNVAKATITESVLHMLESMGLDAILTSDIINFCRQMNALMRSGVPVLKAIKGLAGATTKKSLKTALLKVIELLEGGYPLAAAFGKVPKVFSPLFVSIIHVGENTGELDDAFLKLSVYFEREESTLKRLKAAMRYPMFVIIVIGLAIIAINVFVIPTFTSTYAKLGADLPATTRFLMKSSKFFIEYGPYTGLGFMALIYAANNYLETKQGRYIWGKAKLNLPVIGSIYERTLLARFTYSLSTVLKSGVPMTSALTLVAEAVDNDYIRVRILAMRSDVEAGITLYRSSVLSELFTPLVLQMIAVGDESGRVAELLEDVGEYYEREVDYDLGSLTAKIEPLLIVVVGCMVLVLGLGVFEPMWNMSSAYKEN